MTDDSSAEKAALKTVWPESVQLLCHFHVAQAEWRWLFANGSKIPQQERPRLMRLFQAVMYANTVDKLETAVSTLLQEEAVYPNFVKRFKNFFTRKSEWLLLDRQTLITRQNNTNNFCEATIRILKDVVLCRTKAYNIVALTDFCISVWNSYLKQKLMAFAYSRRGEVVLLYNNLNKKTQSLSEENLKEESEHLYTVKSADGKNIYTVNVEHGVCTCEAGASGAFCKHQFFVMKTKGMSLPNAPPISANDRYRLAKLALGAKSPDPSFF
ncbi:uncharacterized protein [Parasteatoda tepidariorum]|uniref:uncharacterized protein n=1 Tax=Parasteatoda tepidariorum TaxID=114398 RepID=UPI001C720DFB|nr:uncharacterized protein LOC107446823 [Parasteatoda tepidariorum]